MFFVELGNNCGKVKIIKKECITPNDKQVVGHLEMVNSKLDACDCPDSILEYKHKKQRVCCMHQCKPVYSYLSTCHCHKFKISIY
eukprot:m.38360 g.38360  ORF g.38360 m.38360 type:complete len:85 (-) comp16470_c0_seq3:327-581(-)